jgi:hypothetical protein
MSGEETSKQKVKEPKTKHDQVAVASFDNFTVVVCRSPDEAYALRNQEPLGFIRDGFLVKAEKVEIAQHEESKIIRAYFGLRHMLFNIGV